MSDEELELVPVLVNDEVVYVNRFGELWRWKRQFRWSSPKFQKIVTKPTSYGYIHLKIGGKMVMLHRIIASVYLGLDITDLKTQVDHISGMKHDNRLVNLRLVTHQQNGFNQTKAKGYWWNKRSNKWQAKIGIDGRNIHLGLFIIEEDARDAYMNAKLVHHKIP